MTTLVLSAPTKNPETTLRLPTWIKRFVNALVASRVEAAAQEMRRHDALIRDLGGDGVNLSHREILPFTV
ncbi:hypothetical protein [Microvirga pudoricolor]|uniref:hypothetical protein n=1 Tax=Microvirga pudoricolor TaxID=2778729 RepID=UPI0019504634|nr:hypothetical protein [Microvirga pudoricolor]MBM6595914.1 hypothetical protein [Microvirga pudoricolor]